MRTILTYALETLQLRCSTIHTIHTFIHSFIHSELMQKQKRTSWSTRNGKVMFPILEKEMYKRFIYTSKEGKWIKRWWFNTQAKRIISETYPEHVETFKISARRFTGFRWSNKILLRRKTHVSQKSLEQFCKSISQLHSKILREIKRRWNTYTSTGLADMVQTPLLFVLVDNKTYDKRSAEEVWIAIS